MKLLGIKFYRQKWQAKFRGTVLQELRLKVLRFSNFQVKNILSKVIEQSIIAKQETKRLVTPL
ncbi:MAG TPA: hypothetical protein VGU44_03560 [Gammaproteobacteria bacterium]|nr:hypothetical protein [Gammaproteobacteria bacterium]